MDRSWLVACSQSVRIRVSPCPTSPIATRGRTRAARNAARAPGRVASLPTYITVQPPSASGGRHGARSANGRCRIVRPPSLKRLTFGRHSSMTSCEAKSWGSCASKVGRPRCCAEVLTLCWIPRICDASKRRRFVVRGTLSSSLAFSTQMMCSGTVLGMPKVSMLAARMLTQTVKERHGLPSPFSAGIPCGY